MKVTPGEKGPYLKRSLLWSRTAHSKQKKIIVSEGFSVDPLEKETQNKLWCKVLMTEKRKGVQQKLNYSTSLEKTPTEQNRLRTSCNDFVVWAFLIKPVTNCKTFNLFPLLTISQRKVQLSRSAG